MTPPSYVNGPSRDRWGGVWLVLALFLVMVPSSSRAGITGSLHDFSTTGAYPLTDQTEAGLIPFGACSACHLPHHAAGPRLWPRTLDDGSQNEEAGYFDAVGTALKPDYVQGATLLCYDCHVDYITGGGINTTPDNDPNNSLWRSGREPQDIAFGDGPGEGGGRTVTGYYEHGNFIEGGVLQEAGGLVPGKTGNPGAPDRPAGPLDDPGFASDPEYSTGGHFWRLRMESTNTLVAPYDLGDKLDCSVCHTVHNVTSNQVMLREVATDGPGGSNDFGIGTDLQKSAESRTPPPTTQTGRAMCAGCHLYQDSLATENDLYGVTIPKPPDGVVEQQHNDLGAGGMSCTICHPHNAPDCGACHGNPPAPSATDAYSTINESQGPHPRHANDPAYTGPYDRGYGFDCIVCHDDFDDPAVTPPVHRNGSFQDVAFNGTRNPSGAYLPGTLTCTNLYCHSRGARFADTQNATATDPVWTGSAAEDWSAQSLGCEACHGPTSARALVSPFPADYGAPGYANQTEIPVGAGNEKGNSHYEHTTVMGYGCPTCHVTVVEDANPPNNEWVIIDESLHVNNTSTAFTFDVAGADNTGPGDPFFDSYAYDPAGGTCTNIDCHGGSDAQWGDSSVGDDCEGCHTRTEAAGGDLDTWGVPGGTATLLSLDQWCETGHGRSESANCAATTGWYPWPDNQPSVNPAGLGCLSSSATSPAGGCHVAATQHRQATNPFRLATPDVSGSYDFEWPDDTIDGQSLNLFCAVCHDTDVAQEHSEAITEAHGAVNNWPAGDRNAFKCTDCHDPHGDGIDPGTGPDYMVHARVFTDSSDDYGVPNNPATAILPTTGSIDFDVTTPVQAPGDYVNTTAGQAPYDDKICQVCHTANAYFRRDVDPVAHNTGVECMQCHSHDEGFKATACEVCHSENSLYLPLAPIVMGDGTDAVGTTLPFDDGTWGYNINGHGTKSFDPDGVGGPQVSRPVRCDDCHDISVPVIAGNPTHLDGTRDTYDFPGSTFGGPNVNTSHLDEAMYFGATTEEWDWQTNFDAVCFGNGQCHAGMSSPPHRHETSHGDDVMRFGDHSTVADPKQVRPGSYWTPWTIGDITTDAPPPADQYGTCIACHDPHGADTTGWTTCPTAPDGIFHMVKQNPCNPSFFCNSNCHRP